MKINTKKVKKFFLFDIKTDSGKGSLNFTLNNHLLSFSKVYSNKVVPGPTEHVLHFFWELGPSFPLPKRSK